AASDDLRDALIVLYLTSAHLRGSVSTRSAANTNNANNQRGTGLGQKTICYECRVQRHFKRECPKLKINNNHGNQGGRNNALARVYTVSRAGTDPDANVVTDSNESRVTYTDISSPFEELSDIGSPRADDHKHLMLPEMLKDPYVKVALQAPPPPDYIPGPEEPEQAPPSPDYVPSPEHADDEIVAEDQPYAENASPIAQSPEYVPESNYEAHPEDDDDEDPEEDPVDYLTDGGDDGDDEEESSEDDEDDDMDIEADEEEEEEHPSPADSVVIASTTTDQAPSAEETEPFETDESATTPPPHPAYRVTARISIPAPVPMSAWTNSEVVRLLAISSPPASPLSPCSSPPPQIPFPPLPPILSPPSLMLSPAPPPSPIHIALGLRYEVGESSSAAAARPAGGLRGAPVSTEMELGGYMREFETRVRQDTDEIYKRMSREAWVRATDASDLVYGTGDSPTGTGDSFASTGYHITGTTRTRW
nr:hypothetical protein [Tanacetum cinerariifolium]